MISTRLRAALLMFQMSAGYRPMPVRPAAAPGTTMSRLCNPRLVFCGNPFTVNVDDCSGNDVGMPPLTALMCQVALPIGIDGMAGAVPGVAMVWNEHGDPEHQTVRLVPAAGVGSMAVPL